MSSITKAPIAILQNAWKRIAPLELADNSWDNVGVMIEAPYPKSEARTVLLAIDLTTEVCDEALSLPDCSLVVAYHPPIFSGLKSMKLSNTLQASLLKLSAKGISVFSPHTSLDAINGGINTWLTSAFESNIKSSKPIEPKFKPNSSRPDHLAEFADAGMGRIVQLNEAIEGKEAIEKIKKLLGLPHVMYGEPPKPSKISTIALCAGSGGSMFKNVQADLFWTGEMTHHQALAMTQAGSHIVLCNHTNTERGYLTAVLKEKLEKELNMEQGSGKWEVIVSRVDKDPLRVV